MAGGNHQGEILFAADGSDDGFFSINWHVLSPGPKPAGVSIEGFNGMGFLLFVAVLGITAIPFFIGRGGPKLFYLVYPPSSFNIHFFNF